jgi:signal transduction histidine kinase
VALLRRGASDYVVKPFLPEELRARVRNLVAAKRARDAIGRELDARGRGLEELARELVERKRELELAVDTARIAREQAERASSVKSTFLGMLSHELRTPLTSIQLGIATLRDQRAGALDDRQRATLARIERSAARLLDMLSALLEYTRVESGKLVVHLEEVDVRAVAADVVDETLVQAQRKLIELSLDSPASLPPAVTDRRLLRLVLLNLVVNAIKYTDRGSVRVALAHRPQGHVIEVADTGRGIGPADQADVFEPFRQVGRAGTAQGVGLGLSLVRGVAEALGATVSLESEIGRGSTFRLTLPPQAPGARP